MKVGRLLLVGCGKMGGAMLDGWLGRGLAPADVVVVEPNPALVEKYQGLNIAVAASPETLPADWQPDVMIFAVKPQVMADVMPAYARYAEGSVALSVAAGTTIANMTSYLGPNTAVVRSMPNTPAAIGRGMIVACPNGAATAAMRGKCDQLLQAVGKVAWIEDEALMDAVTAVSGSGPAYVFLLIETMAKAGIEAGLPKDLAAQLAEVTVAGAGALAAESDEPPAVLRQNVTSPGGTTAAALEVLMAPDGMQRTMSAAVKAAAERSRDLAG